MGLDWQWSEVANGAKNFGERFDNDASSRSAYLWLGEAVCGC